MLDLLFGTSGSLSDELVQKDCVCGGGFQQLPTGASEEDEEDVVGGCGGSAGGGMESTSNKA